MNTIYVTHLDEMTSKTNTIDRFCRQQTDFLHQLNQYSQKTEI